MKICVGLTDLCPTAEDISVFAVAYPLHLIRWDHEARRFYVFTANNDEELREWARDEFEIHTIEEIPT